MGNRRRGKKADPSAQLAAELIERLRPPADVDWSTIDFVVGTRDDVTRTGINRPCARCKQAVFTSRRYPIIVAMVCEYCALELAEEDRGSDSAFDDALPFTSGGAWSTDPWLRGTGRIAPKRGPRKLGRPPRPNADEGVGAE